MNIISGIFCSSFVQSFKLEKVNQKLQLSLDLKMSFVTCTAVNSLNVQSKNKNK